MRAFVVVAIVVGVGALAGCGGETCASADDCKAGSMCVKEAGFEGSCEVCPPEVQYDGIDNDCNAATLDHDLDGDGDNAKTAAVGPGGDCDDHDPTVSSRLPEVCGDGKDNDCDGIPDGPPCDDAADPVIRFLQPANGMVVRGVVDVVLDATDDGAIDGVELDVGGVFTERRTVSPYAFAVDTARLADGPVTLIARVTDRAAKMASATITIDVANRRQPSVMFTAPTEMGHYGGNMLVDLAVIDAVGTTRVDVLVDGMNVATLTGAPYRTMVDTRALTEGPHELQVNGTDALGGVTSETRRVVLDNSGPTLTFTPDDGATLSGTIPFRVTAVDGAGVASITSGAFSSTTTSLRFTVDLEAQPSGPVQIMAEAVDRTIVDGAATGNRSARTITITNVNRGPGLSFNSPLATGAYGGNVTIDARAVDPRGVTQVVLSVDSATVATLTAAPYTTVIDSRALTDGTHALGLQATDAMGNTSSTTASFVVDNTGPVITFVRPLAGASVSGTVPVEFTAADANGVARVSSGTQMANANRLTFNLDTLPLNNGNYTIPAEARDGAIVDGMPVGNVTTTGRTVVVFNVGNIPPAIMITSPLPNDGVLGTIDIQATASSQAGVARVDFSLNGRPLFSDTSAPYGVITPVGALTGMLTITATAVGRNGVQTSASVQVEVVAPPDLSSVSVLQPTLVAPDDFVWADVTGDGIADIVAADTASTLSRGRGDGTFMAPEPLGFNSSVLELADYDGDGDLDILSVMGSTLRGLLNDGTGIFTPDFSLPLGTITPSDLVAGDLDGDGDIDVVIAQRGAAFDFLLVHRSNGVYGIVGTRGGVGNVNDLELATIDGDATPDLVIARGGTGNFNVTVFRNADGLGTFGGAGLDTLMPGNQGHIRVADFDGDNYPDLVLTIPVSSNPAMIPAGLVVLRGNPATPGRYAQTLFPTLSEVQPDDVVVGDLDNDGDLDLVALMRGYNGARLYINDGMGNFAGGRRYVLGVLPTHPVLVDVDLDGLLDVVAISNAGGGFSFARNLGGNRLDAAPTVDLGRPVNAFAVGELAGGGLPDFAVAYRRLQFGQIVIPPLVETLRNDGGGDLVVLTDYLINEGLATPTGLAIGDIDGQGGADIAIGSANSVSVATTACPQMPPFCGVGRICLASGVCASVTAEVLLANGPTGYTSRLITVLNRPTTAAIGDVLPGGFEEVVFTVDPTAGPDGVAIFGNSDVPITTLLTQQGAGALLIADVAEPFGLLDLLVANRISNTVTLHRQRVVGLDPAETFNVFAQLSALATGLLAPDALLDLVGLTSNGVVALLGDPLFTLGSPTAYPAGTTNLAALGTLDVNGDGLTDAVSLTPSSSRLQVMVARPQGGFFPAIPYPISDGALDLRVTDVDGDGLDDVVVLNDGGGPGITYIHRR